MVRQVSLPSQPESVSYAIRFVEAAAREAALPGETVDRLVLATGEAVANAIEHGNASDPEREVHLQWSGTEAGGWLTVQDEGAMLTLERIQTASLPDDPTETGGRGLYLIRILADKVDIAEGVLRLWFAPRVERERR